MKDKINFKRVLEYSYVEADRLYQLKTGYFELYEYDLEGKTIMQTSGYSGKYIDFLLRNEYDDNQNLISTKKITNLSCDDNSIKVDEVDLNNIDQLLELLESYEEYYDSDKKDYIQKFYYKYNLVNKVEEINEYWGDFLHEKRVLIYNEKGNLIDGCYFTSNAIIDDYYSEENIDGDKLEYDFCRLAERSKDAKIESNVFKKFDDNGNLIYKEESNNIDRYETFYTYDEENYLTEENIIINNNIITSKVKKYEYFLFVN